MCMALAEVEFSHPDHVYRAEKSWKVIASSLQLVLGCDVEIRISVLPCASVRKSLKFKKPSFCIFSCTRRIPLTIEDEIQTDNFDFTSGRAIVATETSPSGNGAQLSSLCSQHNEPATSIRNDEGNVLEMCSSTRDGPTNRSESSVHSSKLEYVKRETQLLSIQEQENQQPSCFPKKVRFQRRLSSGADSRAICLRIRPLNKLGLSFPHKSSFETFFCISDPCNLCSGSDAFSDSSNNEDAAGKDNETNSKLHCRTAPTFPLGRHGS
ncbi:hypothetical protein IFM89_023518 [Coptis chinensis]|uniref:STICHEL DnaA-N-like alpha-beta domain-containing protein n=1 Tax=Coptis chinensis TaxID=261450 RepID=A0A835HLJ3_9MAGN|nr:hypothetical protein IFM89_023518 [Coptis chinensis]